MITIWIIKVPCIISMTAIPWQPQISTVAMIDFSTSLFLRICAACEVLSCATILLHLSDMYSKKATTYLYDTLFFMGC